MRLENHINPNRNQLIKNRLPLEQISPKINHLTRSLSRKNKQMDDNMKYKSLGYNKHKGKASKLKKNNNLLRKTRSVTRIINQLSKKFAHSSIKSFSKSNTRLKNIKRRMKSRWI